MSFLSKGERPRRVAVLALATFVVAYAGAPAFAGDDGAAPIWEGFGHTLGILKDADEGSIDYHEHGKLVLPPKTELPKPGSVSAAANPAWPQDQEVVRARKAKKLAPQSNVDETRRMLTPLSQVTGVTMSATAGQGPGPAPCRKPDPTTGQCPEKPASPGWNYNPLTWVGLASKPKAVLGPEPDREELTDPPKGFRAPVHGVGAKIDQ